jgi:2-keto-4-pentenoate hydratase
MPLTESLPVVDLAGELHRARLDRTEVPTLTGRHPGFDVDDAYRVQAAGIDLRMEDGETIVGGKLGFTSLAMQKAMGVDRPNFGWLTDVMMVHDRIVHMDLLIHPKVEPEIAFLLAADLDGSATADDVLAATAALVPCLEVVDSRFVDFRFDLEDNIADDSSAALVVLGDAALRPDGFELRTCGVVLTVDGELAYTAAGAAALDHPAEAVAWMARSVAGGRGLRAGDIVISGGLTSPVDLERGMTVGVDIDRIGTASLRTE